MCGERARRTELFSHPCVSKAKARDCAGKRDSSATQADFPLRGKNGQGGPPAPVGMTRTGAVTRGISRFVERRPQNHREIEEKHPCRNGRINHMCAAVTKSTDFAHA